MSEMVGKLFGWVNSEDSLKYKLDNKKVISYDEHKKWFLERLNDSGSYLWIIENFNKEGCQESSPVSLLFVQTKSCFLSTPIFWYKCFNALIAISFLPAIQIFILLKFVS